MTYRRQLAGLLTTTDEKESQENPLPRQATTCTQRVTSHLKWAYLNSPINLSSLTGWRYPHLPRLAGNPFTGRLLQVCKEDGLGFGEEINRAAQLALKDKRGMCYFWMGNKMGLLVTRPADIQQIMLYNERNVSGNDTARIFARIFGDKNIFDLPTNAEWREKRSALQQWLFEDPVLTELTGPMQKVLDEYIEKISAAKEGTVDLEKLTADFTMDIVGKTRLGFNEFPEPAKDALSKVIDSAMSQVANPRNAFLFKLVDVMAYFGCRLKLSIDEIVGAGAKILSENIIQPNASHIRATQNWLRMVAEKYQNPDLTSRKIIDEAAFFLIVGHETTAKFLQYTLMLIAEHPEVANKIRKEITTKNISAVDPKKEEIDQLPYLDGVLKESLRLYPPVPDLKAEVSQSFVIGDISFTNNKIEYETAMRKRDKVQDVTVYPGDFIFFSPVITHRSESTYKNALQFNPDRFIGNEPNPYAWFPFGFGTRKCIGRKFSIQEAKLAIIRFLTQYDLNLLGKNVQHPYAVQKMFSLRPAHRVEMQFTPRDVRKRGLGMI